MSKTQNFKMIGGKKYTLNEKGVYVDKDGYGARALGFQIPKKVRKNAQGEWELVPEKKPVIMGGQKYKQNAQGEWHEIVPEKKPAKTQNFKMVGGKKYTLNEKGIYVDKDGYGARALGFQIPKKVRKNAQGEFELVPEKKPEKKLNLPEILITKDKDDDTHIEFYKEEKRRSPSPEEKRYDTGELDYIHKKLIVSQNKKIRESLTHSRKGNTQTSKSKIDRDESSKNETAKSSEKETAKVVESGGKYKDKFGNYQSKRHHITGSVSSKNVSKLKIKKK